MTDLPPACGLMPERAAAAALGIAPATLRRWRWRGFGPAFLKIGRAVRYDPQDLINFTEAARRRSTGDEGQWQP